MRCLAREHRAPSFCSTQWEMRSGEQGNARTPPPAVTLQKFSADSKQLGFRERKEDGLVRRKGKKFINRSTQHMVLSVKDADAWGFSPQMAM